MGKRMFVIMVMVLGILATAKAVESGVLTLDEENKRVGINTTPSFLLDVQGEKGIVRIKSTTGTNPASFLFSNDDGNMYFGIESANGMDILNNYLDRSPYARVINTMSAYPLKLSVNSKTAMTILDGGNVGIGTTAPSKKLHVNDSSTASSWVAFLNNNVDANGEYTGIAFGRETGPSQGVLGHIYNTVDANRYVFLGVGGDDVAGGTGLIVKKGGNVGIGTTSPNEKLEVTGNAKAETIILGKADFSANPPEGMIFFNKNDKHFYGYNGTSWVRLDSTWVKLD